MAEDKKPEVSATEVKVGDVTQRTESPTFSLADVQRMIDDALAKQKSDTEQAKLPRKSDKPVKVDCQGHVFTLNGRHLGPGVEELTDLDEVDMVKAAVERDNKKRDALKLTIDEANKRVDEAKNAGEAPITA